MSDQVKSDPEYRFGVFAVYPASRELFKQSRALKIQDQPFTLLLLFLDHPGEILDRQFLQQRLWADGTYVDFAQSLSTAVTKLRQVLGDDAANPRFIETVPRRGYRFIAPVTAPSDVAAFLPSAQAAPVATHIPEPSLLSGKRPGKQFWVWMGGLLLLGGSAFFYVRHRETQFALAPRDTVVLADFENTTGEPIFNDSLHQALMVEMAQSPLLHLLPDRNAAAVFRQMGHSPDDRITGRAALELCRRVGGKVVVQGFISSLGTSYLLGVAGIRCDSGRPIAHEQTEVARANDVVEALGKTAARLRARLGESLPSIQKYNAPLEQATTSSLDALQMYGHALSTWDAQGDLASLPSFKTAVAIDPQFAMAYGGLATVYHNLGEEQLARQYTIKAYELRARVTEAERASIEARYYLYVTQEVEKAAETYALLAQEYPDSAGSLNHLATAELKLGRDEEAAGHLRKALQLDPTRAATYINLAVSLVRLDRLAEAEAVLAEAERRGLRIAESFELHYWIAFLHSDQDQMQRWVQASDSLPAAQPLLLSAEADTEAYHGRLHHALADSLAAEKLLLQRGDKESAAQCLARAAVREAEAGHNASAQRLVAQAAGIRPEIADELAAALLAAQLGDRNASIIAGKLQTQFPNGTFLQSFWLPVIHSRLALAQRRPGEAIALLARAHNLDPTVAQQYGISPLYAGFVRGQAYLVQGKAAQAATEFRALLQQPALLLNSPVSSLAALGLARALASDRQTQPAAQVYREVLLRWADADTDFIPARQAQQEAARIAGVSQP